MQACDRKNYGGVTKAFLIKKWEEFPVLINRLQWPDYLHNQLSIHLKLVIISESRPIPCLTITIVQEFNKIWYLGRAIILGYTIS